MWATMGVAVPDTQQTAEEFYSQSLDRIHLLVGGSRAHAEAGDAVGAVACQWAADVVTVEAVAWERIVVVSRTALRALFDVGERVLNGLMAADASEGRSAADVILDHRQVLLAAVDPSLAYDTSERLTSLDHLQGLAPPTSADYSQAANTRVGGLDPHDYVAMRRQDAGQAMVRSRQARVRGDLPAAIEAAYESDMMALDAYLVESALAWGDTSLLTVLVRWELAAAAIGRLPAVPEDVPGATRAVRDAVASVLGAEEADRLDGVWEKVD